MKFLNLTDKPYGDFIQVIYCLKGEHGRKVYITPIPRLEKGELNELTFQDCIDLIEKQEGKKVEYFIMIAEFGTSGKIYRYNNYGNNEICECGETKGYA